MIPVVRIKLQICTNLCFEEESTKSCGWFVVFLLTVPEDN